MLLTLVACSTLQITFPGDESLRRAVLRLDGDTTPLDARVGVPVTRTWTLTDTGRGDAVAKVLLEVEGAQGWSVAPTTLALPAGESADLTLTFTPATWGASTLTLQAIDDGGAETSRTLTATVVEDDDDDGHTSLASGGDDCDDEDPTVHPGATETWYDGIDEDCSGDSDDDRDGDGLALADDCDDDDATVGGPTDETWDGTDEDCDGVVDDASVRSLGAAWLVDDLAASELGSTFAWFGDYGLFVADGAAWRVDDDAEGATLPDDAVASMRVVGGGAVSILSVSEGRGDIDHGRVDELFFNIELAGADETAVWAVSEDCLESGTLSTDGTIQESGVTLTILGSPPDAEAWTEDVEDVDGDGVVDLLVGAPNTTRGGSGAEVEQGGDEEAPGAGAAALFLGGLSLYQVDQTFEDADAVLFGDSSGEYCGYALRLTDVDGDGYADAFVGCPYDDDGGSAAGAVHLVAGSANPPWHGLVDAHAVATFMVPDWWGAHLGELAVASPADLDGDGRDDLAIPVPDAGLVGFVSDVAAQSGEVSMDTLATGAVGFGSSVATWAPDADAPASLWIGDPGDTTGGEGAGAVWRVDAGGAGWDLRGPVYGAPGDAFGSRLAVGPDVDGDGVRDILVGAPGADDAAADGGAVFVVSGR